ncbi:VpaChn25_0724 family phage protein [Salinisphaera orenii]|uniref:VpaChn25_0724 family phage protein n=1 Tax=Salinisphaera orenii TaxID=856731 RepID=UPI000DBE8588
MEFAERLAADRRLAILRLLNEAPEYTCNSSVLHGLLHDRGYRVSRDQVAGDIDWLAEQSLVEAEQLKIPGLRVITLTRRGADIATGAAIITGVARPAPSH